MTCQSCQQPRPPQARFCAHCGTAQPSTPDLESIAEYRQVFEDMASDRQLEEWELEELEEIRREKKIPLSVQ